MKELLCCGGPLHGKRVKIDDGAMVVTTYIQKEGLSINDINITDFVYEKHIYYLMHFRNPKLQDTERALIYSTLNVAEAETLYLETV